MHSAKSGFKRAENCLDFVRNSFAQCNTIFHKELLSLPHIPSECVCLA